MVKLAKNIIYIYFGKKKVRFSVHKPIDVHESSKAEGVGGGWEGILSVICYSNAATQSNSSHLPKHWTELYWGCMCVVLLSVEQIASWSTRRGPLPASCHVSRVLVSCSSCRGGSRRHSAAVSFDLASVLD